MQQARQVVFDLENLAFGAAPVAGRVEDHEIIPAVAAVLAFEEFAHVIDDPADGRAGEVVERGVVPRPIDHALGGIDVADLGAGVGGGERAAAGIGEEIHHPRGAVLPAREGRDALADGAPLVALLGENPEMPEIRGAEPEDEAIDADRPPLRQALAAAPAGLLPITEKAGVGLAPAGVRQLRPPHRLRAGTRQRDQAETLQLLPAPAVEQFVVRGRVAHKEVRELDNKIIPLSDLRSKLTTRPWRRCAWKGVSWARRALSRVGRI